MLEKIGHKNIKYVPHGINTDVFKPATHDEKITFRKEIGLPEDAFIIGMVAHNQYRKMVNRLIDAFQIFLAKNPASLLVMHCLPRDATGWDLVQILKDRGLTNNVLFTDKASKGVGDIHVPESEMRTLYCSFDVHALSTGGEGFGVPIVEAMACGIPNVITDFTTTKEFLTDKTVSEDGKVQYVNSRGIAVPITDIETHHTGGIWAKANVPMMAQAFQYLKDNSGEAKQMGMKARKFAVENYDNELVKTKWKELYRDFDSFADSALMNKNPLGLKIMRIN
jgi:glycosyltransferase involved in cell wall biosynthesis